MTVCAECDRLREIIRGLTDSVVSQREALSRAADRGGERYREFLRNVLLNLPFADLTVLAEDIRRVLGE